MYLLTGCLCGEVPAARSRPPCRAGGFQAESRVAGADGMRSPRQCLGLRQRAAPFLFQKLVCPRSRRLAGSGKSTCLRQGRPAGMLPEAGDKPVCRGKTARRQSTVGPEVSRRKCLWGPGSCPFPTAPPHRGTSSRGTTPRRETPGGGTRPGFAKDKIAKRWLAKNGSKRKRRRIPGSRSLPTTSPHRGTPSRGTRPGFAKGKIAKRWLAKRGVKVQTPSGTGKPPAPDNTVSPGRSQQRDTARFCQTVVGEGLCQSSNAFSV